MQPDNFAQPPPDSVSHYSSAYRLLDAPTEPAAVEPVRSEKYGDFAAGSPLALAIHRVIFSAPQQPAVGRQPARVRRA
jgi:hypothetical protein